MLTSEAFRLILRKAIVDLKGQKDFNQIFLQIESFSVKEYAFSERTATELKALDIGESNRSSPKKGYQTSVLARLQEHSTFD